VLAAVATFGALIWLMLFGAHKGLKAGQARADRADASRRDLARRRVVGQFATQPLPVITDQMIAAIQTPGGWDQNPDLAPAAGLHSAATARPVPEHGRPAVECNAPAESPDQSRDFPEPTGRHRLDDSALGRCASSESLVLVLPSGLPDAYHDTD
jgi:hypothetical protein